MNRRYLVPVTMTDERLVTVVASSPREAREKISEGRYLRLGWSLGRGFLIIGTPRPEEE